MTEVPEHLLQRSRERRAALGQGGGEGGADSGAGATESPAAETEPESAPAAAAATPARPEPTAAPAPAPEPEPVAPYVEAFQRRKKIPIWAMPVVALLPVWAIIYWGSLNPPAEEATGPFAGGEAIYNAQCATCHGATGGGGVGPALNGGAVVETFPEFQTHVEWVAVGSSEWPTDTYGATNVPVTRSGGMPAFGETLTPEEIALVVRYEREVLSGVVEEDLVAITDQGGAVEGGGEGGEGGEGDSAGGDAQTGAESVGQTEGADTGEGGDSSGGTDPPSPGATP